MRALALVVLALALAPAPALAQQPPAYDAMIHVFDGGFLDASGANGTLVKAGGVVAAMSFREQNATPREHTVTADDGAFDITLAPPDNAEGYTLATFTAPTTAGRYPYHDKDAPAHHGLLLVAGGTTTTTNKPAPAFTLVALALALAPALALRRRRAR